MKTFLLRVEAELFRKGFHEYQFVSIQPLQGQPSFSKIRVITIVSNGVYLSFNHLMHFAN